ncbi:hypothetical protein BSKO_01222 [Bryopsis sp. KO-2023]|nr:hypothetical protein BSKO_01222 [Bryopsis sp. KO-2023]
MGQHAFWLGLVCCVLLSGGGWCQTVPFIPEQEIPEDLGVDIFFFDDVGKSSQTLEEPITGTLGPFDNFTFGLEVVEQDGTLPDVLLTLSVTNTNGDADLYCHPWTLASQIRLPSPQFATWRSDHTQGDDHIFISRTNDVYSREKRFNVTVGKEDLKSVKLVCGIFGKETAGTDVELEVDVLYKTRNLVKEELKALKQIHEDCCGGDIPCPFGPGATQSFVFDSGILQGGDKDAFYDFCHARGSFCDEDGRLIRLDMSGYGLTCEFPTAALGKMKRLRKLDMNSNMMTGDIGEIAEELSGLKDLERLSLSSNVLSGTLSKGSDRGLCKLTSKRLKFLNLNSNEIKGEIDGCLFQADSVLEEVHLDLNKFTGSLPEFSPDAKVELLSISNSGMTGLIPESLGGMDTLRAIRLSRNKLLGAIPENIGSPPSLLIVDVSSNRFEGGIPESLANAPLLRMLLMSENNLTSVPESWVSGKPKSENLEHVDLNSNQMESGFPVGLALLPNLQYFNIAFNKFAGVLPPVENLFPVAKVLVMSHNEFEGSIPEEFGSIGMFNGKVPASALPVFTLASNKLTGDIPEFFHDTQRPTGLTNRIFLGKNELSCPEPTALHGINDLVCFTKCDCEKSERDANLLQGGGEGKESRGVSSLSTGAQAAIGLVGAILVVFLVVAIAVVIIVMLRKKKWTTKLNEIESGEGDIEVGTRSANV